MTRWPPSLGILGTDRQSPENIGFRGVCPPISPRFPTTIAWTTDDNFYTEGVTAPKTATSDGWGTNPYGLCLGGRYNGTHRYIGKIHAVRAYSRILTPAELALNARIDRIRYFGEKRPLISGLIFRVQ